jgi:hypothetical protein
MLIFSTRSEGLDRSFKLRNEQAIVWRIGGVLARHLTPAVAFLSHIGLPISHSHFFFYLVELT